VDDVVIGQMGEGGQEQRFRYSCYLDADARVVKSGRQP
jgi:predicted ATP-grasp superfamily ATP-dependent carboligase